MLGTRTATTLLVATCLLSACASNGGVGAVTARTGDVILQSELIESGTSTMYDALVHARPRFFAPRDAIVTSSAPTESFLVFWNGVVLGGADVLRTIRPSDVLVARRLGTMETYYKYGRRVSVGAVELESLRH